MINKARFGETSGGDSAKRAPKGEQAGNGVQDYGDTELMERHQHGPDPVGAGTVIKTNN